ncbi:unnamed protein product [Ixodes pacificus]
MSNSIALQLIVRAAESLCMQANAILSQVPVRTRCYRVLRNVIGEKTAYHYEHTFPLKSLLLRGLIVTSSTLKKAVLLLRFSLPFRKVNVVYIRWLLLIYQRTSMNFSVCIVQVNSCSVLFSPF